jgi:chromosome segregation ATPase
MSSIITNNSFSNCQNLKKIYINPEASISSLDLSKTRISNYSASEQYNKQTSDDYTIYASNRVINQTKFPSQDSSVGTDLTTEEITNLEKRLEQALGDLSQQGFSITNLLQRVTGYQQNVAEQEKILQESKQQAQELQNSLEDLTIELNSSQTNKLILENKVRELNEQIQALEQIPFQRDVEITNLKRQLTSTQQELTQEKS